MHLYHERWQAETAYASIKATMLDGRVLRSRSTSGLEQEIWGVLTVYQALVRAAADAVHTQSGLDMDRISFTVLITTAADTVTTATAVIRSGPANLRGHIGHAIRGNLLSAGRGQRTRPRTRKSRTSKCHARTGPHRTRPTPTTPSSRSSKRDSPHGHDGNGTRVNAGIRHFEQRARADGSPTGAASPDRRHVRAQFSFIRPG